MAKLAITYFFSFILTVSVTAPSYFMLMDGNIELVELADTGEEEDNKGNETIKELDVKIYYLHQGSLFQIDSERKKGIGFFAKHYTSFLAKLTSPPPEYIF